MLQLQPSELMKLALAVFAADLLTRRSHLSTDPKLVIVPVLVGAGHLRASSSSSSRTWVPPWSSCCIAFGILFIGGVPMRPILKIVGVFGGLAIIVGLADPYRRDRILSFLHPGATRSGSGYQVWQSLIGLGSGHLFGLGLGGGREKWGTLPNAHTDFIFSVVGEELGLVGAVVLLGLFFALAWFGLRAATRAPDRFGSLLAVGITTWITSQAVINIGAVIGVLPVTGIPLPFISFGGSSLVITMAAVGILLNIASHERSTTAADRRCGCARSDGERGAVRPGGGRRAPPGTSSRPWPSPRPWWTPVTPATPSSSSGPPGVRTGRCWRAGGSPSPCCPGGGSSAAWLPGTSRPTWPRIGGLVVACARGFGVVLRARPRVVVSVGWLRQPGRLRWPPWCWACPWCW